MAEIQTYEVTWKSGSIEKIEATSANCPIRDDGSRAGRGHFLFFKDAVLVLSVDENDIRLIRLIPTPTFVTKRWADDVIEVDQNWLNRAKDLLRLYGPVSIIPARLLEMEMRIPPYSDCSYRLLVIASRELHEEGHKYCKTGETVCSCMSVGKVG